MANNVSLYQAVKNTAFKYPENNALFFMGKYVRYKELITRVDEVASGLQCLGIKAKSIVTMAMPNIFEAIYAFYATNKLGAVCHMVHPLTPVKQMERFMAKTSSHHLIIVDSFHDHYQDLLANKDVTMILASPVGQFGFVKKLAYRLINRDKLANIDWKSPAIVKFSSLYSRDFVPGPGEIGVKETAVYLHSGGTSGEPKTIELSSFAINSLARKTGYILGLDEKGFRNYHMLGVLPMFHGFGLCMGVHAMLINGGVSTLMPKFEANTAVKLIAKNRINCVIGVPSLFESLLSHPEFSSEKLKNLKQAFVGGDYVAMDLKNRFDKVMKDNASQARLLEGYGLTEVVTVCAVNLLSDNLQTSVGKPLRGINIGIVDLETRTFLKPEEMGEIVVSGDTMMNGYLMDKEATKATFLSDKNKQKWVLTGDYGFIDKEGYLHFKQRLKRIVKVLGMPVMPSEIENLLMDLPEVKEVAAIGVPDKEKGFVIKLFLVLDKQIARTHDDDGIRELIKTEISTYAVPAEIVYKDVLPKTTIGKTDTRRLEAEG